MPRVWSRKRAEERAVRYRAYILSDYFRLDLLPLRGIRAFRIERQKPGLNILGLKNAGIAGFRPVFPHSCVPAVCDAVELKLLKTGDVCLTCHVVVPSRVEA